MDPSNMLVKLKVGAPAIVIIAVQPLSNYRQIQKRALSVKLRRACVTQKEHTLSS
ncbi:hypothetical protein NQZ68_016238 [Dissostichus eleginoides]|nr:hypothetical protein NQZ68_016238 [Dissostichus eleginoides]